MYENWTIEIETVIKKGTRVQSLHYFLVPTLDRVHIPNQAWKQIRDKPTIPKKAKISQGNKNTITETTNVDYPTKPKSEVNRRS